MYRQLITVVQICQKNPGFDWRTPCLMSEQNKVSNVSDSVIMREKLLTGEGAAAAVGGGQETGDSHDAGVNEHTASSYNNYTGMRSPWVWEIYLSVVEMLSKKTPAACERAATLNSGSGFGNKLFQIESISLRFCSRFITFHKRITPSTRLAVSHYSIISISGYSNGFRCYYDQKISWHFKFCSLAY